MDGQSRCSVRISVGHRQFHIVASAAYSILHYKIVPSSVIGISVGHELIKKNDNLEESASVLELETYQPHAELLFRELEGNRTANGGKAYYITGTSPKFIADYSFSDANHAHKCIETHPYRMAQALDPPK
jgi:hypothetical protein